MSPFWTYDADTAHRPITGQRGTVYYETRRVQVRDAQRPDAQTRCAGRARSAGPRRAAGWRASSTMCWCSPRGRCPNATPTRWRPGIWPRCAPYQPEFLAGFRAEGYTVPLEEGYGRGPRRDGRGDRARRAPRHRRRPAARSTSIETRLGAVTFKHILLPVWLAAYRYRGRSFRFVVNGQTGRVAGRAAVVGGQDRRRGDPGGAARCRSGGLASASRPNAGRRFLRPAATGRCAGRAFAALSRVRPLPIGTLRGLGAASGAIRATLSGQHAVLEIGA